MVDFRGFYHSEGAYLAAAEISLADGITNTGSTTFYFNRLNVPKRIRNKGIATKLMKEMTEWCDENDINVVCEINPYGDMKYEDLEKFYMKFGFKKSELEGMYLRKHNGGK